MTIKETPFYRKVFMVHDLRRILRGYLSWEDDINLHRALHPDRELEFSLPGVWARSVVLWKRRVLHANYQWAIKDVRSKIAACQFTLGLEPGTTDVIRSTCKGGKLELVRALRHAYQLSKEAGENAPGYPIHGGGLEVSHQGQFLKALHWGEVYPEDRKLLITHSIRRTLRMDRPPEIELFEQHDPVTKLPTRVFFRPQMLGILDPEGTDGTEIWDYDGIQARHVLVGGLRFYGPDDNPRDNTGWMYGLRKYNEKPNLLRNYNMCFIPVQGRMVRGGTTGQLHKWLEFRGFHVQSRHESAWERLKVYWKTKVPKMTQREAFAKQWWNPDQGELGMGHLDAWSAEMNVRLFNHPQDFHLATRVWPRQDCSGSQQ